MCSAFERRVFLRRVLAETEIETLDVYFVKIGANSLYCFRELSQISKRNFSLTWEQKYLKLSTTHVFINRIYERPKFYLVTLFFD